MIGIFESIEVGVWYRAPGGEPFEVVALDLEAETIEIQYYDGAVEELDFDNWLELNAMRTAEPGDVVSGALDMSREDQIYEFDNSAYESHGNPLDSLDWQ